MLAETDNSIVDHLLARNEEFRKLHEEHKILESKVDELSQQKYLSADEELELHRLKKIKLAGKDRMAQIIDEARGNA